MHKRIINIFILFSISIFLLYSQQDNPETDFNVRVIDNGRAVEIIKYVGTSRDVVIPSRIQNLPVTAIGESAFSEDEVSNPITSVIIPNTVTKIGDFAFYDNQLTSITFPNSVTHIGFAAFFKNLLTSITIPNSVTHIDVAAFRYNQLVTITLPSNLTRIEGVVFADNKLTGITIPNGVTHIGDYAFFGNQLTSITIPNSVTYLDEYAFSNNQLNTVTMSNSITRLEEGVFADNKLTRIVIPSSVTYIGERAFQKNRLTQINIPSTVTHIGNWAFTENLLTNVVLSDNIAYVGGAVFEKNRITSVTIGKNIGFDERYIIFDTQLNTFFRNERNRGRTGTFEYRNNRWMFLFPETNLPATPERLANTIWEDLTGRVRLEFGQNSVRLRNLSGRDNPVDARYRVDGDSIVFINRLPGGRDSEEFGSLIRGILTFAGAEFIRVE